MTDRLDPIRLDELWDFSDPQASAERFRAELATAAPVAAAELSTQLARALGFAGRGDEADALLDSIDSDDAVVGIRIALERGRRLNSSGRPAEAVPLFLHAYEAAEAAGEPFLAVDALHMLAIADEPNAVDWAGRGICAVASSTDSRTQRWAIALHNNLGWFLFDGGRFAEALVEFEAADAAAQAHGTPEQQRFAREAIAECRASLVERSGVSKPGPRY
ncbi:MAG: hypothetical protein ABL886_01105 [Rhodoglobus sp.]